MKRILAFVLCAAMLVSSFVFTASAGEAEAQAVTNMIAALTKDSTDEEINAAEDAYWDLDYDDQQLVNNYDRIAEIRALKVDPEVKAVTDMIAALNVNSSAEELSAAIAAYEKLSEEKKNQVSNYALIVNICDEKAKALVAQIDALPDPYFADIYHHEASIRAAAASYGIIVGYSDDKVTNYDKLQKLVERIDSLYAWDANKAVNILNSTLAGLAKYTKEDIENLAKQPAEGIHYTFKEADWEFEPGEGTHGYMSLSDSLNEKVRNERYAKFDLDLKITDVDVIGGWTMLHKICVGDVATYEFGYDFLNKAFFFGTATHISHGALTSTWYTNPHDFDLGVWHHLTYIFDAENFQIIFDGETVLEGTFDGKYEYLICYPWHVNIEQVNTVYTDKAGNRKLSPLTAFNYANLFGKKSVVKGTMMLSFVKTSVEEARAAYNRLTDEQKEQIVGLEALENVEAMIARVGKRDIVISGGLASGALVDEGATVTIVADAPAAGKVFDKWEIVSGDIELADASAMTTTFVVGAENVELKATYKDIGSAITVTGGTADVASAAAGAVVTITADAPAEGMVFDKWEIVSGGVELANANEASTTFTMGEEAVEVKAIYKPDVKVTPGDVNGDTRVNAKDIIAVMKFMLGNASEGFIEAAGDLNGDDRINAKDIILIMKIMLGGK